MSWPTVSNALCNSRYNHIMHNGIVQWHIWRPLRLPLKGKKNRGIIGHAPGYLVDDCQLVTDVRARKLRSADTRTLAVNWTCSSFGDRTFAVAATRVWNSLPPHMRKPELSYGQFRRSLKTFLFGQ